MGEVPLYFKDNFKHENGFELETSSVTKTLSGCRSESCRGVHNPAYSKKTTRRTGNKINISDGPNSSI